MRTVDFSPLYRSFVGFDRLAALLDAAVLVLATGLVYLLGPFSFFFLPVVLVTWSMIYFRLLGRLGLYCIHGVARPERLHSP